MKKILTFFCASVLSQFALNAQIPTTGLVASYPFNGNANNAVNASYNGVVTGAALTTDRNGDSNAAYSFRGNTTDQINLGDIVELNSAGAYSISMWLKQDQIDVIAGIFHKSVSNGSNFDNLIQSRTYSDGNLYGYDLARVSGRNALCLAEMDCSTYFTANTWFLYTVVFDGAAAANADRYKVYINGVQVPQVYTGDVFRASTSNLTGGNMYLGQANSGYSGGNGWNGSIDDVLIYNRAISAAEVTSIYNYVAPTPVQAVLVAHYPFNGNANNSLNASYNGVVTGAALVSNRTNTPNSAYSFSGNRTDQINLGDIAELNNAGAYSIAMWLKQDQIDVIAGIFHKSKSSGASFDEFIQSRTYNDGNLYGYDSKAISGVSSLGFASLDCSAYFSANTWFHYAVVFNGTGASNADKYKVYINGVLAPQTFSGNSFRAASPNLTGGNMYLGQANSGYAGGNGWNGSIDDVYIFSGALTDAEVRANYNASPSSIEEVFGSTQSQPLQLFPNPATGQVTVLDLEQEDVLTVSDLVGKVLLVHTATSETENLDLSFLDNGLYLVKAKGKVAKLLISK